KRAFFERRLGISVDDVRIHTDQRASASAEGMGALAYTVGPDVVFAPGQFAPETTAGARLLAHELAHVVQPRHGAARGSIMRQRAPARQAPVRPATVQEAAEFLEDMSKFLDGAESLAHSVLEPVPGAAATPAARKRARDLLNQQRLRDMLANA